VSVEAWRAWIGRREEAEDFISPAPLARLAATLDHSRPPWQPDVLPPLGHWLFFLPHAVQSEIDSDGHPRRGGFLPPVDLPRRMWAGGSVEWLAPIRVGGRVRRISTIADVVHKAGQSGDLVFVKILHEISVAPDASPAIREEQDIVYRGAPPPGAPTPGAAAAVGSGKRASGPSVPARAQWCRTIAPDPVLLFRFSALTFNGHRIHYDREYCRTVEGYPGLVVHAPLTAVLLMDLFLRQHPTAQARRFTYQAHRPLFDTSPFVVNGAEQAAGRASVWATDQVGAVAMTGEVELGT
jgi:3-methylfumaryl-CoA hydratase